MLGLFTSKPRSPAKEKLMVRTIAIVVGSLRKASWNRKIAEAVVGVAPAGLTFSFVEIGDLPFFNEELEANPPAQWIRFRAEIAAADAVLFVTPEYNRSVPGVLKNAIDVGSRPYGKSSFLGKPIGIVGNSPGALGGVCAVKHLQNIMPGIAGPILGQPEIYLNGVGDAFDDKGQLTKEPVQKVLQQYLDAFAALVDKQNK
jgi:chromate reductase